jgi:hypothetical protein
MLAMLFGRYYVIFGKSLFQLSFRPFSKNMNYRKGLVWVRARADGSMSQMQPKPELHCCPETNFNKSWK